MIKAEHCNVTLSGNGFGLNFEFTNILRAFYKMRADAIGETLAKRELYQDLQIACGDAKAPFDDLSTEGKLLASIMVDMAFLNLIRKRNCADCAGEREAEADKKLNHKPLDGLTKEQKGELLDLIRTIATGEKNGK